MKKIHALFLCVAWLLCMLTLSALAADYVYYENDFSDVTTLSDFTQYRGKWEIVDGQLTLTAAVLGGFLLLGFADERPGVFAVHKGRRRCQSDRLHA